MSTNLATIQPPRASLLATMASKYNMEPETFKQVIKATVMPSGATNEQMAAFLLVANEYGLNPITKEIYAFPARGGGVTPVVGIDGWINLAQRRTEFDGMEHEFEHNDKGECTACTCRIYRKDRTRPVVVTEFMDECRRPTDPWKSHPRRMLRHKATLQAIRYAFGFSGINDEDDAEVIYTGPVVADQPQPAAVADLNARIAETAAKRQAPPPEPAPVVETAAPAQAPAPVTAAAPVQESNEWPQADADGVLVDARGCPWIAGCHANSKTCNADGSWRRLKGADPATVASLEADALLARAESLEKKEEPAQEVTYEMVGLIDPRTAVEELFDELRFDSQDRREWLATNYNGIDLDDAAPSILVEMAKKLGTLKD